MKSANIDGTSDATGNVLVSPTRVNVLLATFDQGVISFPFIYLRGATYLHIMDTAGTTLPNYPVTGTYYYIED